MIEVYKGVFIPQAWHELTAKQVTCAFELLEGFIRGEITLWDVKVSLLAYITNYKPDDKTRTAEEREMIACNFSLMAEHLGFLVRPVYHNPELFEVLSPELQKMIPNKFPFEIYDEKYRAEIDMIKGMLKYSAEINTDMHKNIIPAIDTDNGTMTGPVFDIDSYGVVKTDIRAAEYVDAYDFHKLYQTTRNEEYLNTFLAVLYRKNRLKPYSTFDAQQRASDFAHVDKYTKQAVFMWFHGLLEYFYERSPFAMLFNKQDDAEGFNLGMSNSIYSISAKGYGSKKEVENFLISDYFAIQLREVVEAVRTMKAYDKPIQEIERETGLKGDIILKIK